jgi:hypothetical protein
VTAWPELVATALVGTGRRPLGDDVRAQVATALGADLPDGTPESAVLAAAGVLAAHRRAGWVPPTASASDPVVLPAAPDGRPVAPPTAVQLLELLLAGQVTVPGGPGPLVADWLHRCLSSGRRPPPRTLPDLLAAATADPSLRGPVAAAGGARLAWLAAQQAAWGWAVGSVQPSRAIEGGDSGDGAEARTRRWATGGRAERAALLADLRAVDPERSRALVEETWATEDARSRLAIVETYASGLSMADEPFLEAALDDRSKTVAATAASLLRQLPGSRLAARSAERLRPLVRVDGRLRKHLAVELPDEPDAAARRDGVVDKGAPRGLGPRAWWRHQLVAASPLTMWEDLLALEPSQVVRLVDDADLLTALVTAARRQRDGRWAEALLAATPDATLLALLPPAAREGRILPLLAACADGHVATAVGALPPPWSPVTSEGIVARLRATKTTAAVHQSAAVLAARLDPSVAPVVEAWLGALGDDDHARRQVRGVAHALSIRLTITQELA